VPVQEALSAGAPNVLERVKRTAAAAADATIPMLAVRGRASFLGERSIGHMDPGACSSALVISAVCDFLGE
jgi:dihydroxyacetone kinase-like protein